MYRPRPAEPRRRRSWLIVVPTALVVVLAALWTGGWFYAVSKAEATIERWRAREAKAGRVHTCGSQSIGGYPFRIEVRCADVTTDLSRLKPAMVVKAPEVVVLAQVYDPTLMIGEFTGPLTIAEPGQQATHTARWQLARASLRGTPALPERLSIVIDGPVIDRSADGSTATLAQAKQLELHGRIASGSAADNPVLDIILRLSAAVAAGLHPLAAQPIDADIAAELRGLKDFSPKPWSARFKEMQAQGGRIEITKARIQQSDMVATGAGSLGLSPAGRLDGQLDVTIAGLEKLLPALGLDRLVAQRNGAGRALGALDRIAPGLGNIAAGAGVVAGLSLIGRRTQLEGKQAIAVPLRFVDGVVFLGPLRVGQTPPLF
jgi:hypothetical protein